MVPSGFRRTPDWSRPGFRTWRHLAVPLACALAWCVTAGAAASAESAGSAHRARVSADLADHLAAGSQSIRVIVHGSKGDVDSLAALQPAREAVSAERRGARRDGRPAGGAARRRDVDHLSGDIRDPIERGRGRRRRASAPIRCGPARATCRRSRQGRTVAVIDSGIDTRHERSNAAGGHDADFTGGDGSDLFGHGTHVAAIIAGAAGRTADTQDYRGIAPGAYL